MTVGGSWPPHATEGDVPLILDAHDINRAVLEMLSTGGFKDTPALRRWARTPGANAVLRYFLIARTMPLPTEYFQIDLEAASAEIAAQDMLAAAIEANFGDAARVLPDPWR
jgi:hypothetical protein|tara:strand:- start:692 stop:1024 length:333 start_codon:yes stop_codon:yes gene_type:complete